MPERKKITIHIDNIGDLTLAQPKRQLITSLDKAKTTDKDFFVSILHSHLLEPENFQAELDNLSTDKLNTISYQWAQESKISLSVGSDTSLAILRQDFRAISSKSISKLQADALKSVERAMKPIQAAMAAQEAIYNAMKPIIDAMSTQQAINNAMKPIIDAMSAQQATNNAMKPIIDAMSTQQAINNAMKPLFDFTANLEPITKIAQGYYDSTKQMQEYIPALVEFQASQRQVVEIFDALPTLYSIRSFIDDLEQEVRKSDETLDELGFGFAQEILIIVFGFEIFDGMDFAHLISSDEVTENFEKRVVSPEFETRFFLPFQKLQPLTQRKNIIAIAYQLHKEGKYIASIPVFLPQIEFLLRTLLLIREKIIIKDNKVFASENGKIKQNEKGEDIAIEGLYSLIQHSDLENDKLLSKLVDLLHTKLISARNDILHGTSYKYGKRKTSIQCILLVLVLSQVINGIGEISLDI